MEKILSYAASVGQKYGVSKVVLFGSRARGDHSPKSDYDIAFISPKLKEKQKADILEDIDKIDTLHKIDVVFLTANSADGEFTKNIEREGIILMSKFKTKFQNFQNAIARLSEAIEDYEQTQLLSVRDGVIQRFEFTTELSWKTVREYLTYEGVSDINTPKAVMTAAFAADIIEDEEGWLQILRDRNITSQIYEDSEDEEVFKRIKSRHIRLFEELCQRLASLRP